MNETVKRAISGAIYVAVMLFGVSYQWSFHALFVLIGVICIYEMLKLRKGKNKFFSLLYVIIPLIFIHFVGLTYSEPIGFTYHPAIIMFMFILTWTFDTFAYLVGKPIGKHKIMPSISPKKSWEGFLGGFIFMLLVSHLINPLFVFKNSQFNPYVFAIILPFTATLGDFLESHFKRQAGVKDSGNFIPGHGGMLDRMDAFMITIPILYIYLKIFCR